MKALMISDLHLNVGWFDWVESVASGYDVVVCAGDFLDRTVAVELSEQIRTASDFLMRLSDRTRVIACSGNHDVVDGHAEWITKLGRRNSILVDGQETYLGGLQWNVLGWSNVGKSFPKQSDKSVKQVWIHHAPPNGSGVDWDGERFRGDRMLNEQIEISAPLLVLCGHVHVAPFVSAGGWNVRIGETTVLNAGHLNSKMPQHIEIDVTAETATWNSGERCERISFANRVGNVR